MPTRRGTSGLRPHSRSSSATRLGANLQFTTSQHKGEPSGTRGTTQQQPKPPSRISSAQRVASREHVSAYGAPSRQRSQGQIQAHHTTSRQASSGKAATGNKPKAAFTLASNTSHSDEDEDEDSSNDSSSDTRIYDENEAGDDDEWVSSESGAQTPNSGDGSEMDEMEKRDRELERKREEKLRELLNSGQLPPHKGARSQQAPPPHPPAPAMDGATAETPQPRNHLAQQPRAVNLTRVDTARPDDISRTSSNAAVAKGKDRVAAPGPSAAQMPPPPVPASALAKASSNGAPARTHAPTQQRPQENAKLTIQTTSPTPPTSNARTPAPAATPQVTSNPTSPRARERGERDHARRPSSRPHSTYTSRHSSGDVSQHHGHGPLRPHPLIRGQSFGLGGSGSGRNTPNSVHHPEAPLTPKHAPLPSQLQPLTVIQDSGVLSGSPEDDKGGYGKHTHYISSSPTGSVQTVLTSPGSPDRSRGPGGPGGGAGGRRTSVSSVHSTMTVPVQGSNWSLPGGPSGGHDRKRTTSSLSHSSSAAALSSLVSSGLSSSATLYPNAQHQTALSSLSHLPSVTRPPSPQAISFFPPMNTQVKNEIEGIHPLLPPPYIGNHLAVLARRNPVWESWERVGRAKREMRSY